MVDNVLIEVAKTLSVGIVNWGDNAENKFAFKNEVMQSGLNIGAYLYEAQFVFDRGYFIYKLELALKECLQLEYWLEILLACERISKKEFSRLQGYARSIRRALIKICIKAKSRI